MNVRGPFTRIRYKNINLNSTDQVKKYLLSVGWIPTQYNINKETREPTSPKLTEDSFSSIKDDTGKLLARRAILVHRRRQIENYKDPENKGLLAYVREDGRVPAEGITCATPTGRSRHRGGIVNIPKASDKVVLGKEMRSLFICKEPYKMIGSDLMSIETRILAHCAAQFDGGAYWTHVNTVPDIHQYNADLLGCDRNTAKVVQYSTFYGASAKKTSTTLGCSIEEAQERLDSFWSGNPGIKMLIDYLEKFYRKNKYIVGLDGRKLTIRGKHKLLNSLIQSAAGIIFKRWDLIATAELHRIGLDCTPIIRMHDEIQYRCLDVDVEDSCHVIVQSAARAGEYYELKVPIGADCKVGSNWAMTH